MASITPVLSDVLVEQINRVKPGTIVDLSNGMWRVSTEILTTSLSTSTSSASNASPNYSDIPIQMQSAATIQYFGFSADVAKHLFRKWEEQVQVQKISMLSFCQSYVRDKCEDVEDTSDDWAKTLDDVGIHGRVRSALLDPRHLMIRGIQSLSEWLCEILQTNHDALANLPDRILDHFKQKY